MAYKLRYSDYVTEAGPPDPERWRGPPGPQGEQGPPGPGKAIIGTTPSADTFGLLWWDSNSGQLFVQYDDGTSIQWVSANSIDASTLEGSFLPITGGTMQGPLNYTATGGTVSRSAQDRAADVVNVLDYGADPTGVADSSDAINAALAVVAPGPDGKRKAVYLPAGLYRVNKQITLTSSQALFGDSRGSSRLYVDDRFDPAASSVILVRAGFQDAGPTLRDFGITFAQPSDQGSRANFKTLAAGGTSATGGTGVRYPWAIAAGDDSFRTQIIRVRIGGAWDGITSNNHNAVFWLDDVEMGALDCGVSLGEGASGGIQDFTHVSGYHFWNFDLGGSLWNVYNDGTTIGMRVGRVDSFDIRDLSMFCARLIFTADSNNFTFCHIVNCQLDGDPSGIEVNGQMRHLGISNLYGGSGTTRVRPFVSVNARCNLQISNYSAFSSSNYPDFVVNDFDADVTLGNFHAQFFTDNIRWVDVQRGVMRIVNGFLYLNGPRTVSAIAETSNGHLIVDNVTVQALTPSGPLVSVVTTGEWSMIGRLSVQNSSAWTYSLPAGLTQRFFSPQTVFSGSLTATAGSFTTLSASSTVSGAGFSAYLASPPAIGGTTPAAGTFVGLTATGTVSIPSILYVPPSDNGSIQTGSTNFSRFSTSGHNSTGYGKDALNSIQNGASNTTAYGAAAGWSVNTASSCVFVGALSGWGNGLGTITGNDNTCVGNQTALNLTSGARNSLFGSGAGNALTTGSDNIAIGNAVNLAAGTNNTINIGNTIILTTTGPTIRSGSGAATGTQPAGSIWLRTDGTTANRFYVSAGGGTWAAVAGV